jgi:pimeloyl-ACP methyl ester carboxylesterase
MKYETIELTSETRSKLPGDFIKLSDGYTHYELADPGKGSVIVFVNGFVTSCFAWDKQVDELTKQGFQVLRYDLFGRGFSDRPNTVYDNALFVRQLYELLTKLKLTMKKVILVGWSMGGAISISFTNAYPELVSKLILVAPTGFPFPGLSLVKILKIPLLNKLIFYNIWHKLMTKRIKSVLKIKDTSSDEFKKSTIQMEYKGFLKALLLNLTQMNIHHLEEIYSEVGKLKIDKMLIWGKNDNTIPFNLHERIIEHLPGIIFHPMENVGHAPHYHNPRKFNELILKFIED